MNSASTDKIYHNFVSVSANTVQLEGDLVVSSGNQGIVLIAHGMDSSSRNSRSQYFAELLQRSGLATLLIDLLIPIL